MERKEIEVVAIVELDQLSRELTVDDILNIISEWTDSELKELYDELTTILS